MVEGNSGSLGLIPRIGEEIYMQLLTLAEVAERGAKLGALLIMSNASGRGGSSSGLSPQKQVDYVLVEIIQVDLCVSDVAAQQRVKRSEGSTPSANSCRKGSSRRFRPWDGLRPVPSCFFIAVSYWQVGSQSPDFTHKAETFHPNLRFFDY
jgi:hypothetical protein